MCAHINHLTQKRVKMIFGLPETANEGFVKSSQKKSLELKKTGLKRRRNTRQEQKLKMVG